MPANLHLDPAVVRAVAGSVAALVPALRVPALDPVDRAALARLPGGEGLLAEHDRIASAVARTVRELGDLVDDLDAVAGRAASTEHDVVRTWAGLSR